MANDQFRWVSQPADDNLTSKMNEIVSDMEESGYELEEKDVLERTHEGKNNNVMVLLHFSERVPDENEAEYFIDSIDISIGDDIEESDLKQGVLDEQIAEKLSNYRDDKEKLDVTDIRIDETGRTAYLVVRKRPE